MARPVGVVYQELHIILLGRLIRRSSLTGKKGRSKSEAGAALLDSERVSLDDLDSREEMMTLSMDPRSSAPVEPGCVVLALACSQQHACLIETLDSLPQFTPKPAPEKVRAAWQNHSDRERQRFADRRRNRLRWARAAGTAPPPTPPQGTKVLYDATDRVEKDVHHRRFVLAVAAAVARPTQSVPRSPSARPTTRSSSCAPRRPPRRRCWPTSPTTPACRSRWRWWATRSSSRQLVQGLRDARSVCVLSTAVGAHSEEMASTHFDTAFGQLASAKADEASVMLSTAIRAVLRTAASRRRW